MISVLGTGVAGLCSATALTEAGYDVEIVVHDARPVSHMAGGMLAPWCEAEAAPDVVLTRGQTAIDWWSARYDGVVQRGTLAIAAARDLAELDRFGAATSGFTRVDPKTLEPDLEQRFSTGLFFPKEAHLNPTLALSALMDRLKGRGVKLVDRPSGTVVDCTGWAARQHLTDLRPVRGELVHVYAPEVAITRTVRLMHPRFPCYIVPRGNGFYAIGATMQETSGPDKITARAMMELLSAAYTVHPAFAEAEVTDALTGLRPSLPDNLPTVQKINGRYFVNGFYRHGFLMAPAIADDLTQMIYQDMPL